jgi:glycolate oxidase FAD binding subunit
MTTPAVATQTLAPSSIDELAAMVRAHNRGAIYPVGCGSWQDLGYPPTKPGVAILTKGLNRVVDYPHEELTITVEAGILISDLQRILAEKGQMLPIDCPHPENATLGGLLATNTSGPRRLAYGTARDSVLGLDVIDATGTRIHGGGRVVKNVAGYDMPKMHIGALGTLGIIVEATLKVRPLPDATRFIEFGVDRGARLTEFLTVLRSSPLRPTAIEVGTAEYSEDSYAVSMFFEECREAVERQVNDAKAIAETFGPLDLFNDFRSPQEQFSESIDLLSSASLEFVSVLNVKPTSVPRVMEELWNRMDERKVTGRHITSVAVMNGIVRVDWEGCSREQSRAAASLVQHLAAQHRGRFSFPRCPAEWKRELPIWGDVGPEIEWMRRLRTALDPDRTLNPGRFVVE